MRVSGAILSGLVIPAVAYAFLPQSLKSSRAQLTLKKPQRIENGVQVGTSWSQDQCSTQLNMAFDSDKASNMFDGPMALTRERDACGVGFIANTQSGGKK